MKYLLSICAISAWWFLSPTYAHDYWADGKPVPNWVKTSCCGPADAHHLRPDQVHKVIGDEAKKLRPKYASFVGVTYYTTPLMDISAQYTPVHLM
jgi:hypothetical protein